MTPWLNPTPWIWARPLWFVAIPCLLIALIYLWRRPKPGLRYPSVGALGGITVSPLNWLRHGGHWLRILSFISLALALARPQDWDRAEPPPKKHHDIILVTDASGSMRALDFELAGKSASRLEAVKDVVQRFIAARTDDRMGLVVFGTYAFTQSPLTLDRELLLQLVQDWEIGIAGEETAIGEALGLAVKRLDAVPGSGRAIILLTDGTNTAGSVDPRKSASIAADLGIKVYTIGVGRRGRVPMPTRDGRVIGVEVPIDEPLLQDIARVTGAQYFRAEDREGLQSIYSMIDKMEQNESTDNVPPGQIEERFALFLWPAIIGLGLDLLFRGSRFSTLP